MHAYLIVGKDKTKIQEKAEDIAKSHEARLLPFVLQKIVDVRELQSSTKLSVQVPIAFFIEDIDSATTDALNAFLKQLEEPGKNIYFILSAGTEDKVLSTIVSRCQVMRVTSNKLKITSEDIEIESFTDQAIGMQFQLIDKIKKREDAVQFLQQLIESLHSKLLHTKTQNLSFTSKKQALLITCYLSHAQAALTALEKNGNVTSQLTKFIVQVNS